METHGKNILKGYLLLLLFLAGTIACSYLKMGLGNEFVSYGFATGKAYFILVYFMDYQDNLKLSKIYFLLGLLTASLLLIGILDDLLVRTI